MNIEEATGQVENSRGSKEGTNIEKVLPKIHSIYIYHLTKYFLWPEGFNQKNFNIGVFGNESAAIKKELEEMAKSIKANGQEIRILQFNTPDEISLDCHIIYVPYESSNHLNEILLKTQKHPVLIVSAKAGLGKVGSPVNFITIDGKTSFELNEDAIEKRALKFVQQLKAIAILL
ncbi:MAG: YfiR family protein [Bacteroidetes bacterium]|nr:YfiR family protein [Bacteroidota bacterium]